MIELIQTLRTRYSPPEVPPCPVCNQPLALAMSGGGLQQYQCCNLEHASASRRWIELHGDRDVLAILDRLAAAEADAARYRAALQKIALDDIRLSGRVADNGAMQCAGSCGAVGSSADPWSIVHDEDCPYAVLNPPEAL